MKRCREQERQREKQSKKPWSASQGHTEERRPCVYVGVCYKGKNSGEGRPTYSGMKG